MRKYVGHTESNSTRVANLLGGQCSSQDPNEDGVKLTAPVELNAREGLVAC